MKPEKHSNRDQEQNGGYDGENDSKQEVEAFSRQKIDVLITSLDSLLGTPENRLLGCQITCLAGVFWRVELDIERFRAQTNQLLVITDLKLGNR